MTNEIFVRTTAEINDLTLAALNEAAVNNRGDISDMVDRDIWEELPKKHNGYGLAVIGTLGTGCWGSLVLTPRSRNAAEMLRQGWVSFLIEAYDLSQEAAASLYDIARTALYGLEDEVLETVVNAVHENWTAFDGTRRTLHWVGIPRDTEMTCPRLLSVRGIVLDWREVCVELGYTA